MRSTTSRQSIRERSPPRSRRSIRPPSSNGRHGKEEGENLPHGCGDPPGGKQEPEGSDRDTRAGHPRQGREVARRTGDRLPGTRRLLNSFPARDRDGQSHGVEATSVVEAPPQDAVPAYRVEY